MTAHLSTWPGRILARPWLLLFVPVNAATSGFGVMLPLLILLRLHGTLLDVALAATLFNGAVIGASVLWGYLSDRWPDRRLFLVLNFAGYAVIYAVLGAFPSLPLLLGLYTVVGLLAPAGASASNLLILERFPETERGRGFASFQEMSILGSIAGVIVGYLWLLDGGALPPLLFVFAALAAASTVAALAAVGPSTRRLTTGHVARHPESLISRLRESTALRAIIPFFPGRPGRPDRPLRRLGHWAAREIREEIALILTASFLFTFASNLFNTSYTPYMESVGISSAAIFLVNGGNNTAQGLFFPLSGTLAAREGSDRLVRQSTYFRSLGYLAMAGFTFLPVGVGIAFGGNLVVFAGLGAAIALYSTASTLLLFRGLEGHPPGTFLGVSSALGGGAAVLGAGLSGLLSYYGSYRLTFLASAAALLVSLPVWSAVEVAYARRHGPPGPGARGRPPPPSEAPTAAPERRAAPPS